MCGLFDSSVSVLSFVLYQGTEDKQRAVNREYHVMKYITVTEPSRRFFWKAIRVLFTLFLIEDLFGPPCMITEQASGC